MIREMTLGQYYQTDSLIHRLDPRVKLAGTLIFVISLFFPGSAAGMGLAVVFLILTILASKVPPKMMLKGIRPLMIIIIFSAVINLFFTPGITVIRFGPAQITMEGIRTTVRLVLRLVFLIMGSSVMTFTTTPNQLTAGLEKGLGFLKYIHIPVHEFAMMMSIALRFIPILTEELDKIMKAQMSRGVDFEEGTLIERGRKMISVLLPLFISAIRRASELALAMEARCYHGGEGRTMLHPLKYQKRDYLAWIILGIYLLLAIAISVMG